MVLLATTLVFVGVAVYLYGFRFFAWVESDAAVTGLLAAKVLHARSPVVTDWYYANGDVWGLAPHLFAILRPENMAAGELWRRGEGPEGTW